MLADILHLHAAVMVTSVLGSAGLDILSTECVLLWPGVQSYDVDLLAVVLHAEMTSTVCDHTIGLFAYDLLDNLNGEFRCDNLRIVVSMTTLLGKKETSQRRKKKREKKLKPSMKPTV